MRRIARPRMCIGCPGDPRTSGYQAWLWGGHVPPYGPQNADMLVVGIIPGEEEEVQGRPFVGPSGKKIRHAIDWASEGRELRVRWMNIVNCRTRKPGKSQKWINRDPTALEFRECAKRFLLPELRATHAKVILLLGQLPFELVLQPLGLRLHNLPRSRHKYTFALCMGHRNYIPRRMIL